jgi:ligand-binding sensor domain-containing protein
MKKYLIGRITENLNKYHNHHFVYDEENNIVIDDARGLYYCNPWEFIISNLEYI